MNIELVYTGEGAAFKGYSSEGNELTLDGSPNLGGQGKGPRPMELVLFGLAGCMAMDVLHIISKARAKLEQAKLEVNAQRVDAIPAIFEQIHLCFHLGGEGVTEKMAQRAIDLSLDRYCSVAQMLSPKVKITAELHFIAQVT